MWLKILLVVLILISVPGFSQDSLFVTVGDTFLLKFEMELIGKCHTLAFDVVYDSMAIKYERATMTGLFEHEVINLANGDQGRLIAGFNIVSSNPPLMSQTSEVMTCVFVAEKAGETQVEFENGQAMLNQTPIESEWVRKKLAVQEMQVNRVKVTIIVENCANK